MVDVAINENCVVAVTAKMTEPGARPVMLALGGSRAYGYNRPNSDCELVFVYALPAKRHFSLTSAIKDAPEDWKFQQDGLDYEVKAYELLYFCRLLAKGNAAAVEGVCGSQPVGFGAVAAVLSSIVLREFISQRMIPHLTGHAEGRQQTFLKGKGSTKDLLSAARLLLTGAMVLQSGKVELDIRNNLALLTSGSRAVLNSVIEARRRGLDIEAYAEPLLSLLDEAWDVLNESKKNSHLRENPSNEAIGDLAEYCWSVKKYL